VLRDYWTDVRRIVIPYDRGAMYFAILDSKIRKASHGKRSVDDLIRVVVDRNRKGLTTDEASWVALLRRELGDEGVAVHEAMMGGQTLAPDSDAYSRCFHRVAAQIRRYQLGYDQRRASVDGVVVGLIPGSEADKAGIQEHDTIVLRTNTDGAQRDPQMRITVRITRDGSTFPITYLPRGEPAPGWQWDPLSGLPESNCRPVER
jgi:predicted metalloprotease with PDZ domain